MNESTAISETPLPPTPAPASRSALLIVFLVVFIDLLGFGIVLPLLPVLGEQYVTSVVGSGVMNGAMLGLLMASFSLMQFFFAPAWGRVSDRNGRRPILLLGLLGSVVFYALFGFAASLDPATNAALALALFFVSRIGAGISGATIATAQAVIADCTPPEKRKHGMALIGAAFGIGFTFGPLIGYFGLAFFKDNPEAIGYTAAGISLVALLLGIAVLPETRRFAERPPLERRVINVSAIRYALTSSALAPVVWVFFLATFGFAGFEVTLSLLLKKVLRIDANRDLFLYFAYIGFVLLLTQGFLYRRLAKHVSETTFMTIGIVLMGAGVASLGIMTWRQPADAVPFADLPWFNDQRVFLVQGLTFAVVGFAFLTPSAQALISRRTDADHQGEILGVNQSAASMARILGPLVFMPLFEATPSHLLPYAFGTAVLLVMLPMMPRVARG
jgi:DHA1 family tetracycline resistance protein-like MFS transporter